MYKKVGQVRIRYTEGTHRRVPKPLRDCSGRRSFCRYRAECCEHKQSAGYNRTDHNPRAMWSITSRVKLVLCYLVYLCMQVSDSWVAIRGSVKRAVKLRSSTCTPSGESRGSSWTTCCRRLIALQTRSRAGTCRPRHTTAHEFSRTQVSCRANTRMALVHTLSRIPVSTREDPPDTLVDKGVGWV